MSTPFVTARHTGTKGWDGAQRHGSQRQEAQRQGFQRWGPQRQEVQTHGAQRQGSETELQFACVCVLGPLTFLCLCISICSWPLSAASIAAFHGLCRPLVGITGPGCGVAEAGLRKVRNRGEAGWVPADCQPSSPSLLCTTLVPHLVPELGWFWPGLWRGMPITRLSFPLAPWSHPGSVLCVQ